MQQPTIIDSLIDSYFKDTGTEEILLNGCSGLTILGSTKQLCASPYKSAQELQNQLQNFSFLQNKRLDPYHPSNGGIYKGFRWHIIISPISTHGPIVSLRKHRFQNIQIDHFDPNNRFATTIDASVASNKNIIICGPTGSGKTSLLAAILAKHLRLSRLFILEEVPELPTVSEHWVHLSTKPRTIEGDESFDMHDIFRESLRMRPERMIIGEVREKEAKTFSLLLDCAQGGNFTTMHSHDLESTVRRFKKLNVDVRRYPLTVISVIDKRIQSIESNESLLDT